MANLTKIPRVRFNLKYRKSKDVETLLFLIFRYRGFTVRVSTGLNICPQDWNDKKHRPIERQGRRDLTAISRELDRMAQTAKDVFIENDYGAISPKDFKKEVLKRTGRLIVTDEDKRPTLTEFFDIRLAEMKTTYKHGTLGAFTNGINRIREFIQTEYQGQLEFEDVDWNFRQRFVQWSYEVKNHSTVNTNRILSILSMFLNEAARKGYHQNKIHTIRGWKEKIEGDNAPPIYLTVPEIQKLARLELKGIEKRVRDLFLIGVFTGQRWSDFHRYKPENFIHEAEDALIRIRQQKTANDVYIPLDLFDGIIPSKTLTGILKEYGYRSPKASYGSFNSKLRMLCKRIGLHTKVTVVSRSGGRLKEYELPKWQAMGSHCARRSFCTILYKMDLSPAMIMKVSGHKTESQFYKYIGVTAKEGARSLAAEMRRLRGQSPLRAVK